MKHQHFQTIRSLALAVAVAVLGMTAAHSLGAVPTTKGNIYNARSEKCLQPENASTALGVAIVLEPCDPNSVAQLWKRVSVNGSMVHYMNQLSGLCLDARGGAANGTPVQQWTCNTITNENWQYEQDTGDTQPKVLSRVSGTNNYCLDIPGAQTASGLAVQIYICNGTPAQHWYTP